MPARSNPTKAAIASFEMEIARSFPLTQMSTSVSVPLARIESFSMPLASSSGRSADAWSRTSVSRLRQLPRGRRLGSRRVPFGSLLHESDHVRHALRPIGTEMFAKLEPRQSLGNVHLRHFCGRLVLHRGQDEGDNPLGNRSIAVGKEMKPALARGRIDPD